MTINLELKSKRQGPRNGNRILSIFGDWPIADELFGRRVERFNFKKLVPWLWVHSNEATKDSFRERLESIPFSTKSQSIVLMGAPPSLRDIVAEVGGIHLSASLLHALNILHCFGSIASQPCFSLVLKLFFVEHTACGANIEVMMLEKHRVYENKGKNFDVFHLFDIEKYGLSEDEKWNICERTKDRDLEKWNSLLESMEMLAFEEAEIDQIFSTIAAILVLGNIRFPVFNAAKNNDGPKPQHLYEKLLEFLNVDSKALIRALTIPKIRAGREYVQMALSEERIELGRESLMSALFERCFFFLVWKINEVLSGEFVGVSKTLTIVNPAQVWTENEGEAREESWERLWRGIFVEHLFYGELMTSFTEKCESFSRERLNIEEDFADFWDLKDKELLDCFLRSPDSIKNAIEEETIFPRGTDEYIVKKIAEMAKKHEKKIQCVSPISFRVCHSFGSVVYEARNFILKNKSFLMRESLTQSLSESKNNLISLLFNEEKSCFTEFSLRNERINSSKKSGSSFISQVVFWKDKIFSLISEMRKTDKLFAVCEERSELKDVIYASEKLREKGFVVEMTYEDFARKYDGKKEHSKEICEKIIEENSETKNVMFGITQIFMKEETFENLEKKKEEKLFFGICVIQSASKAFIARQKMKNNF